MTMTHEELVETVAQYVYAFAPVVDEHDNKIPLNELTDARQQVARENAEAVIPIIRAALLAEVRETLLSDEWKRELAGEFFLVLTDENSLAGMAQEKIAATLAAAFPEQEDTNHE